jgi:hypothetical protein
MLTIVPKALNWLKSVSSEPDGNGSASRIIGISMTFTLIGLMIAFFCFTHGLPSPEQFYGMTALLGAASSSYVSNKLSNIGKPPGDSQGDK